MTLRLILVRHAKSSWDSPFQEDHDRVLNARGRRAAVDISKHLKTSGFIPAEVACSSARRTVETWERMAPAFPDTTVMRRVPEMYLASTDTLLACLRNCAASPVMMLAHNPGIADFAARLLQQPCTHPRFSDFPTCSTLVVDFDAADWAEIRPGSGALVDFVIPADLKPA